jgi:5-formyltetrahydrofolate cyclo-ligase
MATPRLKSGFLLVRPENVKGLERHASTIKGAFRLGVNIRLENLSRIDLIITGCVAVDLKGFRLGKGGGYGDREIRILRGKFGSVPVATTVHDLQIVNRVPREPGDEKVNIISTPSRVYLVGG